MTSNIKTKKISKEIMSIIIDEQKTYNSLSFKNLNDLLKAIKKLDADKKVKVIIPIAQIGKYHLGKQVTEECTFCSPKYSKEIYEPEGVTLQ